MGWEEGNEKYQRIKAERRAAGEKYYTCHAVEGRHRWMTEADKAARRLEHERALVAREERIFRNPLSSEAMAALWEACRRRVLEG